ncbi:MAG: SPOR domain-containing protein [Thermodesulfobacteriota bacterium]
MKPKPFNRSKRYLLELSRAQLFFSIAGLLFILSWVFILGIFVGRGYVSETISKTFTEKIQQLQEEKKALTEKYLAQSQGGDQLKEDILEPKLDFYNKLSGKEAPSTLESVPKPTPPPQVPGPQSPLQGQPVTQEMKTSSKTSLVETKVPTTTGPVEIKKPIKAPLSDPKNTQAPPLKEADTNGGVFIIQLGSYRDEAVAQAGVKRLNEKGYKAQVRGKDLPQKGGKWYRIQLGPFKTRFEAERTIIKLEHDGFQGVVLGKNY